MIDEPPVHMLVHETAQALLDFIANRRGAKRGRLPGWLGTDFTQYAEALPAWMNEGIAVHLSSSYEEVDGRIVFREGLYDRRRFAEHAGAVHPMSLADVLELDTRDFFDPEGISLEYSQTYTLVHFLLFGEDGRYRPRFVRCIRDAYLGQASPSHVLDVLGTPAADLERAWTDHVARLAE